MTASPTISERIAGPAEPAHGRFWHTLRAARGASRETAPPSWIAALDALPAVPAAARVAVLRNFAVDPLLPWLRAEGYARGVRVSAELRGYGSLRSDLASSSARATLNQCDAVLVACWLQTIWDHATDPYASWPAIQDEVLGICELAAQQLSTTVLLNTQLPPLEMSPRDGGLDAIAELNDRLRALAAAHSHVAVIDLARWAAGIGLERAVDARLWRRYQAPLAPPLMRSWAGEAAQAVAARMGRARKVLVLDCDDTLWGGILGEDGPQGIRLEPADFPGCAFYRFQQQVLQLHRQGVLLALNSKNNERDVLDLLRHHPHCLLKPEHLAAWRINWEPKPANLVELAAELRLDLDSFVFLDDSPVECESVRQSLPMVEVICRPAEASDVPTCLRDVNVFAFSSASGEDRARTRHYQAERARTALRAQAGNAERFLASLDLQLETGEAQSGELARVTQLMQRTNQFNLTARRHSAAEVEDLYRSTCHRLLVMRARDRFGDYGLTGVAVLAADAAQRTVALDTLLLSCRVLGRGLENAFLAEAIAAAQQAWPGWPLCAEFRATAKNEPARTFYPSAGFVRLDDAEPSGAEGLAEASVVRFTWPDRPAPPPPPHIRIHRRSS